MAEFNLLVGELGLSGILGLYYVGGPDKVPDRVVERHEGRVNITDPGECVDVPAELITPTGWCAVKNESGIPVTVGCG